MPKPQRVIVHAGRTQTLGEWARELGVHKHTLAGRINRIGLARAMKAAPPPPCRDRQQRGNARPDAAQLEERFGEPTLADIADQLGVTRQAVALIEAQALTKVRFGLRIIDICGQEEAAPLLEAIKHQTLSSFYVAARAARRIALAKFMPITEYETKEDVAV